jgi:isopenicillin-N N-acyltransferase-like protein
MRLLMKKKWIRVTLVILGLLAVSWIFFYRTVNLQPPEITSLSALEVERVQAGKDFYTLGNSWLKKNNSGLWEMYIEGRPFERGVAIGKLSKELIGKQEDSFVEQIYKIVPSKAYLRFLKYFIAWFNRNLNEYVNDEYRKEIYGISFAFADKYDFIGTKYQRILNYHAAHDIGHALQDKNMVVGCTSFSAWGSATDDHSLIVGRNFDFYVGDKFAEDKIVCFYKPDSGYRFMMVTWGGMAGAVSGMNEKGITVTLNAAKSKLPSSAATPISLVAREVLQYASSIKEAFAIISNRKTFVSETLMIGSAPDHKTVLIEKTPFKTGIAESKQDYIICSNHFQGDSLKNDEMNLDNIKTTTSAYRYERMHELIENHIPVTVSGAAEILRNQKGLHGKNIGMGNEKAINQLIAHHSVIFKPEKREVWVSSNPYQLGQYICYDLNKIFRMASGLKNDKPINETGADIPADGFLMSPEYTSFLHFKELSLLVRKAIADPGKKRLTDNFIAEYTKTNPEYYETYLLIGDYYRVNKNYPEARAAYETALTKEVATVKEKEKIKEWLEKMDK